MSDPEEAVCRLVTGFRTSQMEMMVVIGGRERTRAEYRALLEAAGLQVAGAFPLSDYMVIEAVR